MLLAAKKCVHVDEKDAKLKAALDVNFSFTFIVRE